MREAVHAGELPCDEELSSLLRQLEERLDKEPDSALMLEVGRVDR